MANIDWKGEVDKRKNDLIRDLQGLLRIKSVLNESGSGEDAPLGMEVKQALEYMLELGERDGFSSKNVGNLAGHLEMGAGDGLIAALCHVDVVPEGDGWSVDPFGGEVKDGKIFARGAIDDKGPTMAAYYGMKIVSELGLPVDKRIRLIIGTDEESNWRCVNHYFEHEEMPDMGFAPDADFPIINAEKGIADFDLKQKRSSPKEHGAKMTLISFFSGRRYNMVPDHARAVLDIQCDQTELLQLFNDFKYSQDLNGSYYVESGYVVLELEGISAHGMEPDNGKNAGLLLANFLSTITLDRKGMDFVNAAVRFFFGDSRGRALGVQHKDEKMGDLTINVGKMTFNDEDGGRFGLNMRYPASFSLEEGMQVIMKKAEEANFEVDNVSNLKPHHVPADDILIQKLIKVYEEQTNEKAELLSISGGTYARSLKTGVAFGALFPGRPDVAHQKDEYMEIEDLLRATALYAQAFYELAQD
ncbi:dipeptidase PepV [Siminovitchia fortis]|uniref:dipeptidase PepV n=1 Tax=Siminovitchia fortis TaxID=254758 RepID=UPI00119D2D8F|nr:dipeptidase PepV [Siminovitchia fortis]